MPFIYRLLAPILALIAAPPLVSHPMGNFSISRYARLDVSSSEITLTYMLDFAEIPTLELLQEWQVAASDSSGLDRKAEKQASKWLANLVIMQDSTRIVPKLRVVETEVAEGAGGMPVLRIGIEAALVARSGTLHYKDQNYPTRAGWKEIVIRPSEEVRIEKASHSARELSRRLRVYPIDPAIVPPQDVEAFVTWSAPEVRPASPVKPAPSHSTTAAPPIQDKPALPPPKPFASQQTKSGGAVQAGDSISKLLQRQDLGAGLILLGLLTAFGLGAMHALSPGHGKTIVAAYLVGTRGTLRHALLLGSVVTFTHTVSVFLLGIGVLLFQRYIVPEQIIPILGAASGLSIVCIGGYLLYKRLQRLSGTDVSHTHNHAQTEELASAWTGGESGSRQGIEFLPRAAKQRSFVHTHSGSTHSHIMPEETVTIGSLVALGASGGLVPCPSALILMLSAIAVGHTALGLSLLVSFSAGLAAVLMGIGVLVLYAKELVPDESRIRSHPAFRFLPVFSAVVVMILGVLMTMSSLGLVQPLRFLS